MYAGNILELADRQSLFHHPLHPYTRGLLRALPRRGERRKLLDPIPGDVCNPMDLPAGCKFHPRCEQSMEICSRERPLPRRVDDGHWVSCHLTSGEVRDA